MPPSAEAASLVGDASFGQPARQPAHAEEPQAQELGHQAPPSSDDDRSEPLRADVDEDFSPFATYPQDEDKPQRGPLRRILLGLLLVAALAAAFWFLAPDSLKQRLGLAAADTQLQVMVTHQNLRQLASGNTLYEVSGRVINPTAKTQKVPPIRAELESGEGRVVYRWTIAPPAPTLPPGGSAPFNSAEMNVPAEAKDLTVSVHSERS
jgi:hypothetical protein